MTINERIYEFNNTRNLLTGFNLNKEGSFIAEELSELLRADSESEHIDALCDIIVFATGAMYKMGYDVDEAMNQTLLEVESRTGKLDMTGKWSKHSIQENPYKADYSKAKWSR